MKRGGFLLAIGYMAFAASAQDTTYAREVIRVLTSKSFYGRGYLHNGLKKASAYLADELKKNGAAPLFNDSYLQPFFFDVNTFPKRLELKIDGKLLRPGIDYLAQPESGSASGRFALTQKDSVTYLSTTDKALTIHLEKKLMFSVAHEALPWCAIQLLRNGPYTNTTMATAEVRVKNRLQKNFANNNVGGFLHGQHTDDTLVIFTAHYDHLGGMGQVYFPGASDNASGTSMVLNLLRYYRAHPPKYKTLFILFAGEEAGLLGSKHFVESAVVDLKKVKFVINLDLLGTGDNGIMVVNGAIHEREFELLNRINAEQGLVKEIRKRGKARNSDHYWFTEAGVPAFFIYTLGGNTYYHDVRDKAETLPLTDYVDVVKLITGFVSRL